MKENKETINKLEEEVSRYRLSQLDGTEAMNANTIMERTVLASLEPGKEIARGHFLSLLRDSVGMECLEALGHAGNNSQGHITTKTAAQAKALAEIGRTVIGSRNATCLFFKIPRV